MILIAGKKTDFASSTWLRLGMTLDIQALLNDSKTWKKGLMLLSVV